VQPADSDRPVASAPLIETAIATAETAPAGAQEKGLPEADFNQPVGFAVEASGTPEDGPVTNVAGAPHSDASSDPSSSANTRNLEVSGVWAPDATACPTRPNRKRLIPAVITSDGASAGDTFCAFKKKRWTEAGLEVLAQCASTNRKWTTKVQLKVNRNRLVWTSDRGSQAYLRCEPNMRMAEAR
jgi:hypothetical protein